MKYATRNQLFNQLINIATDNEKYEMKETFIYTGNKNEFV